MKFRLASRTDLPEIRNMYKKIIKNMKENGMHFWNDIYPCEIFAQDIANEELYLLYNKEDELVAALTLCETNEAENAMNWKDKNGKALYLERLGVNVNYGNQGIGSCLLEHTKELAKSMGIPYLRLFVVDNNEPAIRFYEKNGFQKLPGIYEDPLYEDVILREYGYELEI